MVEILYCAWNRLALTEVSFDLLRRNTDWSLVDRLVIYDDGSEDGTLQYLDEHHKGAGPDYVELRHAQFRSPPTTMNDYLSTTEADVFAKIDSDIAVPPGWLPAMLGVMERNPWLELLGMEAARTAPWSPEPFDGVYAYEAASHIGGVGLMRTRAFHSRPPLMSRGRYGFTEWQHKHDVDRGWITPDIPVVQLDLIPEEPWISLAAEYVEKGWARRWPAYDALRPEWWRWLDDVAAEVAA